MRILYFSQGYSPHDYRFLAALAKTKHRVFYLKLEGDQRQIEDRPVPSQIEQISWAGGRAKFRWGDLPRLTLDMRRVINVVKPDLIHAGPIQTCAFISVLSGSKPVLTMSWGFDLMQDAERNSWWRYVTRYTLRRSAYFACDANVTLERAIRYGMNPKRTVVFPWGVDLNQFRPQPRPHNTKTPIQLFCNRSWERRYGVDVLAKAFVLVAAHRTDVRLILLGGGSQAAAIRKILDAGGALARVEFGGQVSQADLPGWYHRADLFISPSHVDGSSVSLMEALACGLPVLVSDIPANREWVHEGYNGWLFPDGDAVELAAKILSIIANKKGWLSVGQAARKSAEAGANWNRNFRILLKAYEQAVLFR